MGITQVFQEGGPFMYCILLFGLLTFGFIIERTVTLFFKTKETEQTFSKKILDLITRGDLKAAETAARSDSVNTSAGSIVALGCGLRSDGAGEMELQARMDERLTAAISKLDRRTGFLAMFGNVATLLGLLGTITGMIHSFAAVATASPTDRATMLSKGISEAMNCTAFGLIVAIPALVAYAVFQNRTDRIVGRLVETVTEAYHDLIFLSDRTSATTSIAALDPRSPRPAQPSLEA